MPASTEILPGARPTPARRLLAGLSNLATLTRREPFAMLHNEV